MRYAIGVLVSVFLLLQLSLAVDAQVPVIEIKAQRFHYTPDVIELSAGQAVELHLSSADVLHGFSIPQLKIRADIVPGTITVVSIPALAAGEYRIACDIFCGANHSSMSAKLVVK
jgi:cytochrome c oxidase subunit 2